MARDMAIHLNRSPHSPSPLGPERISSTRSARKVEELRGRHGERFAYLPVESSASTDDTTLSVSKPLGGHPVREGGKLEASSAVRVRFEVRGRSSGRRSDGSPSTLRLRIGREEIRIPLAGRSMGADEVARTIVRALDRAKPSWLVQYNGTQATYRDPDSMNAQEQSIWIVTSRK